MPDDDTKPDPEFEPIVLAFFDVLGFSERVKRIGLTEIHRQYQELLSIVKEKSSDRVIVVPVPVGGGGLCNVGCRRTLQHAYFSDTVFLWVKYELPVMQSFLDSVLDFFCEALVRDLPMRGCITFGDAIMKPNEGVFLGDPIIEGARGEAAQSWLGVSFGPSVNQPEYGWLGSLRHVIPYHDHAKPGKESFVEPLVLDWPRRWRDAYSDRPCATEKLAQLNTDARFSGYYDGASKLVSHSVVCDAWWESFDFKSKAYGGHILADGDPK